MDTPLRPHRANPPPSTFVAPSLEDLNTDVPAFIVRAFEARQEYVKQEAGTMTISSLRCILEKDLNVEAGFLIPYKKMIRNLIQELLQGQEERSPETEEAIDDTGKGKEKMSEEHEGKETAKPKMKRLKKKADSGETKVEAMMPEQDGNAPERSMEDIDRDIRARIWEAAHKRASDFKKHAETLTVNSVRRLLEKDLELEKGSLDIFKDLIRSALDEILSPENAKGQEDEGTATKAKKRTIAAPEDTNKSSNKRKSASGEKVEKIEGEETSKVREARKKKTKVVQDEDEGDVDGKSNESGLSSSEEADDKMPELKKISKSKPAESKPLYSKKVENLRSIVKECGITVPPSVYKKAKQYGESQRERIMTTELEAILLKEGLTASASKDEIKAVRKRKEKLKDLEGIDTGNIIEESRGRRSRTSADSFFAPRRNDPIDLGDEDEDEDDDGDEDDNSEGDPNVELQDDDDDED